MSIEHEVEAMEEEEVQEVPMVGSRRKGKVHTLYPPLHPSSYTGPPQAKAKPRPKKPPPAPAAPRGGGEHSEGPPGPPAGPPAQPDEQPADSQDHQEHGALRHTHQVVNMI